jgi:ADP-ribose pyrophosphatase YjhB (NUDIX family)
MNPDPAAERHLTVSGFVVHEGRTALYWHRKLEAWLPSGGHIEANEDPIQATLRELREEFQVEAEVLHLSPRFDYTGGPVQLEAPHALLDCWAKDHWHVNSVYFCRLVSGYPGVSEDPEHPILWLDIPSIEANALHLDGRHVPLAPDVQALAIASIQAAERFAPAFSLPLASAEERGGLTKAQPPGGEVARR